MGKSVYSLVLTDEIVAEVDMLATQQGLSRSALIDHVLAEYANLSTARQVRHNTVAVIEEAVTSLGFRGSVSSGGILTLRTALRYKYNPALQYVVELYEGKEWLGQLRVDLRSQNETLLTYIQLFFKLWNRLEEMYLPNYSASKSNIEPKRYIRLLTIPNKNASHDEIGEAIAAYVTLLDCCMKTYFNQLDDAGNAIAKTEETYTNGLKNIGSAKNL